MNAALLAAYAELDALRLAAVEVYDDGRPSPDLDDEIYEARRKVWRLENRMAARRPKLTRAQKVRKLYAYCVARRPELRRASA